MKSSKFQVSSFKLKIVFYLASCILYLASSVTADAAYTIYLKNGSVITGVSHYEKSGGEIKFYFGGGMIGIAEADILRIEGSGEPVKDIRATGKSTQEKTEPPKPETRENAPGDERAGDTADIKPQPDETDPKAQEISRKESELKKVEGDLLTTRARIQNLFGKSSSGTISAEERSMLQQNMMRKRKLENEKKRLEEELKALREGR